jgi:N-acetyl-gamma-glutamyl-phosphate reductase
MDRGIFSTIYATPSRAVSETELLRLYRDYYGRAPFVRVVEHLPATKDCAGSNFFDVTVRVVRGRVVVLACLDNLIRGASGVAVQNFNRMIGQDERTALL